ncbi:carbon-nitrogen hydrolase family protein [Vibrio sp. WXL210]|uniref:carbon-nitrogen hydrolase family protein n=1 Tax=Vibrio sp. WXL210 TaxID=3450709 RepID=UPI003EC8A566
MKSEVRVALAQYRAVKGNISDNVKRHEAFCASAVSLGANIIVFPELSLTGYELERLNELAVTPSSSPVQELSDIAVANGLTVIAGCPLASGQPKPYISAMIFHPSGEVDYYRKQYLHQGESEFCLAGDENYSFTIGQMKFALAVCADFTEPRHSLDAQASHVDVYLVSALISKNGFAADSDLLSSIASKCNLPVVLSNFVGETGGWSTAGQSSAWDRNGDRVIQGSQSQEGITICTISNDKVCDGQFQPLEQANCLR